MIDLIPYRPSMAADILAIWQTAIGDRYPIMPELWQANTAGDPSFRLGDVLVAAVDGDPVGFVLAKRWRGDFPGCERYHPVGVIALLAVRPDCQRRGVGRKLLQAAERQLEAEGVRRMIAGGSFYHFLPGIPSGSTGLRFFPRHGYTLGPCRYDVRRRLSQPPVLPPVAARLDPRPETVRPFVPGEGTVLVAFLKQTFPGRWARDMADFLAQGGDIGTVMGVFDGDAPCGFAHLHPPGSPGTLRWRGFDSAVAALGPIGISPDRQGLGLGMAVLIVGLERLIALGADDTVIDWTDLLEFYGRCGFVPWQTYTLASRDLP